MPDYETLFELFGTRPLGQVLGATAVGAAVGAGLGFKMRDTRAAPPVWALAVGGAVFGFFCGLGLLVHDIKQGRLLAHTTLRQSCLFSVFVLFVWSVVGLMVLAATLVLLDLK
jgi:hypothetical protein